MLKGYSWDRGRLKNSGHGEKLSESRYFIVISQDGELSADLSHVSSYTEEEALALAQTVLSGGPDAGFCGSCYCIRYSSGDDRTVLLFLDCETRLQAVRSLMLISLGACAVGILLSWLLVALFSRRAVRPFQENYEKQKRFITDASHELKTPLSVISANMDILLLDDEDNEWVHSTQRQVGQLRRLVNDMVFLARSDEAPAAPTALPFDLAALFRETAEPFAAPAEARECTVELTAPA